jgi:hypothetical protein
MVTHWFTVVSHAEQHFVLRLAQHRFAELRFVHRHHYTSVNGGSQRILRRAKFYCKAFGCE